MSAYKDILDLARKYRVTELLPGEELPYSNLHIGKAEPHERIAMEWIRLKNTPALCKMLQLPQDEIENLINNPHYMSFQIPKKGGGSRKILAPERKLKEVQSRLNDFFQAWYATLRPNEVHGFIRHYSHVSAAPGIMSNAKTHVGRKYVLNLDISDFFPGISAKRILDLLLSPLFRLNEKEATAIALLCTWKGSLPAGAPTSPALANFICLPMDEALSRFAQSRKLNYSRYADDLSFSTDTHIGNDEIYAIRQIISDAGFKLNDKKQRLLAAGRRQTVTGLSVNQKVNLPRPLRRRIRAMVHDLEMNGAEIASLRHFGQIKANRDILKQRFLNILSGYYALLVQVHGKHNPLAWKIKKLIKIHF